MERETEIEKEIEAVKERERQGGQKGKERDEV
jgi:hypothetical protein